MELKFRNLTKDEVEVRVGAGKSLLLYKTARVDAQLLDEVVGSDNWQCKFYQVKNTMFCSIGVFIDERKEWVWKDDCGDDDLTMEKVKGEASDSFKRAGFRWGIGRNLYTAPKIKIPAEFEKCQFFEVESIGYADNGDIKDLVITTNFGKDIVFSYKNGRKVFAKPQEAPKKPTNEQLAMPTNDLPFAETPKNAGNEKIVNMEELQDIPFSEEEAVNEEELNQVSGTIKQTDKTVIWSYINGLPSMQKDMFYARLNKLYFTRDIAKLSERQGAEIVRKISEKQNGK